MSLSITNSISGNIGAFNLNDDNTFCTIQRSNPIIDFAPLSDWEIKMGQIDAEIQQIAYEKYPVEMSGPEPPKYAIGIGLMPYDKNAKKREKLIKELTRQHREKNPEYDSYCYRKEQKEKEFRKKLLREGTLM